MEIPDDKPAARVVGRYALFGAIASGGMATVHFGRLLGPVGFSRTVAIKRLHAQYAADPEFVSMFLDEARLAARIRHPNVVPTLDIVAVSGELFLVMEYVPGESLSRLVRAVRERGQRVPIRIVSAIMAGVLHGLHAAHEAKTERGEPLGIVHRDVSPQNVLVGTDGQSRVLDFGVAKAAGRMQQTRDGQIKGKLSYMAPEQLQGATVSRQSDIYAASVVLWELLTSERLFVADNEGALLSKVLAGKITPPSRLMPKRTDLSLGEALDVLDEITLRGLSLEASDRFSTAREMAIAIERTVPPATATDVAEWVELTAQDVLLQRAGLVAEIESSASTSVPNMSALNNVPGSVPVPREMRESIATRAEGVRPSAPASGSEQPALTQVSSISVARPAGGSTAPPAREKTATRKLIALVAVVIIGSVMVWRARIRGDQPHEVVATPSEHPAEPATAMVLASSSAIPIASTAPPVAAPSAVATATTSATAIPSATAAVSATTKRIPRTPTVKSATPPPPDCTPPYTWDAEGRKHFKPNCI